MKHGSVVISAITSCTNTSNPSVMLGAGLLAKKAVERGLSVAPYIKTSMSPGSGVVTYYLQESGVTPFLQQLGFDIVGYGCMTCIGNSGPLPAEVVEAIEKGDIVACGVLSGNRNFEGRVHPNTRANYLASPLLVVAYALAGTVSIDFEVEPIGNITTILLTCCAFVYDSLLFTKQALTLKGSQFFYAKFGPLERRFWKYSKSVSFRQCSRR